jgi:3-phenylpropionate/trans-cinnamate dioxygenase ferredoxin reductase subunit
MTLQVTDESSVLIVGAGAAGAEAARSLRRLGFGGHIHMVGAEGLAPYERPPLSKEALTGDDPEPTWLLDAARLRDLRIDSRLDDPVVSLDIHSHSVRLASSERIRFDLALIATGAEPRRLSLPGADLPGVISLRSYSDARAIREKMAAGGRIVIIGGGFIGLEVAAAARANHCAVSVIEAGSQLMGRVVPKSIADIFAAEHRRKGVELELGRRPTRLLGSRTVEAVELDDGRVIPATAIVVGIGVTPRVALAEQAGARTDDGILVDTNCQTSVSGIFAAGDCCRMSLGEERRTRVEAWQSALDQGGRAARGMLGLNQPAPEPPWMWSDQYDLQLQAAGAPTRVDQIVQRGDPDKRELTCFQLHERHLVGVIAVNRRRDVAAVRRALHRRAIVDPASLTDESQTLRHLLSEETV